MAAHPFGQYINYLRDIGPAGVRVNAAKHIDTFEFAALVGKIGGGAYRFREVNGHAGETVIPEMCYQIAYMLIAWASSILSTTVSSSSTSPRS